MISQDANQIHNPIELHLNLSEYLRLVMGYGGKPDSVDGASLACCTGRVQAPTQVRLLTCTPSLALTLS